MVTINTVIRNSFVMITSLWDTLAKPTPELGEAFDGPLDHQRDLNPSQKRIGNDIAFPLVLPPFGYLQEPSCDRLTLGH